MLETANRQDVEALIAAQGTDVPRVRVGTVPARTLVRVVTKGDLTYLLEVVDPSERRVHLFLATWEDGLEGECNTNCILLGDIEEGSTLSFVDGTYTSTVLSVIQL